MEEDGRLAEGFVAVWSQIERDVLTVAAEEFPVEVVGVEGELQIDGVAIVWAVMVGDLALRDGEEEVVRAVCGDCGAVRVSRGAARRGRVRIRTVGIRTRWLDRMMPPRATTGVGERQFPRRAASLEPVRPEKTLNISSQGEYVKGGERGGSPTGRCGCQRLTLYGGLADRRQDVKLDCDVRWRVEAAGLTRLSCFGGNGRV